MPVDLTLCEPWISAAEVSECGPCADAGIDADLAELAAGWASEILYELSGRRWPGVCEVTVRPCTRHPGPPDPRPGRHHTGIGSCVCGGLCRGCRSAAEALLGVYPIVEVDQVLIDGAVLDPSSYRVDESRWLVRVDGGAWPCCQDLSEPTTEAGTWAVTVAYGARPTVGGEQAAKILACQLALGCAGSSQCRIPDRVQTITRQGMSMTIVDPREFIEQGFTGITSVDMWLASLPSRQRHRPMSIASPDTTRLSRRVTVGGS